MVPMAFPMTYKLDNLPLIARYPIDLWEKQKRPAFSERQWCMLCQLVAENDMEHLHIIWSKAQKEMDRIDKERRSVTAMTTIKPTQTSLPRRRASKRSHTRELHRRTKERVQAATWTSSLSSR